MAEKKATTKAAAPKKAETTKKAPAKKAPAKKAEVVINVESVGFRAGDVYQALAAADKALPVAEIATIRATQQKGLPSTGKRCKGSANRAKCKIN